MNYDKFDINDINEQHDVTSRFNTINYVPFKELDTSNNSVLTVPDKLPERRKLRPVNKPLEKLKLADHLETLDPSSSLYESALDRFDNDNHNDNDNMNDLYNNTNDKYSNKQDNNLNDRLEFNFTSNKKKPTVKFINKTVYKKNSYGNSRNKFVDGETLNSYSSINEIKSLADENVDILRSNLAKVFERDDNLQELEEKSSLLSDSANQFRKTGRVLKNRMFWKYLANIFALLVLMIFIIYLIIKLI